MTTSFWDKLEIDKQFAECENLKQIITRIETEFSLKGEVICEIRVNGMRINEEDEGRFAESRASEIREIAVSSNRPEDLIRDALASALELAPNLELACIRTAELFRGADLHSAQRSFHEALEGCQWMIDTIIHVRGAASGIQKPISQPERWFDAEKIISKTITEVSSAYAASDFSLVADLLEYDLTMGLSIWKETLQAEKERR